MKALYKAPNERTRLIDIDNTLEALQKAVGGCIETVTFTSDACVICDEDGRLKGLPFNCKLCGRDFVGPVLLVGVDGDEFTDIYKAECVARLFFGDGCV